MKTDTCMHDMTFCALYFKNVEVNVEAGQGWIRGDLGKGETGRLAFLIGVGGYLNLKGLNLWPA